MQPSCLQLQAAIRPTGIGQQHFSLRYPVGEVIEVTVELPPRLDRSIEATGGKERIGKLSKVPVRRLGIPLQGVEIRLAGRKDQHTAWLIKS